MASPLGLLSLVVWSILVIAGEGRTAVVNSLSKQEIEQPETSIKTIHTEWGDIYDCVEFHKQPAFNHPLLKDQNILMNDETISPKPNGKKSIFSSLGDGCPKGTVPIRRTTKEDVIRAQSLSSWRSKDNHIYRAGAAYRNKTGIYGAEGTVNAWHPDVHEDQYSSAELSIKAGPSYHTNAIKYGWTVNPKLYGDHKTRSFVYWTGDGGHKTGCYNTLCPGFVQVHESRAPGQYITKTSEIGGEQLVVHIEIYLERPTGKWWLILDEEQIGYWPSQLFPLFKQGVESIFWGGRVKEGADGVSPPMASGLPVDDYYQTTGYFADLQYIDDSIESVQPESVETIVECYRPGGVNGYTAKYWSKYNRIHFGGALDGAECHLST